MDLSNIPVSSATFAITLTLSLYVLFKNQILGEKLMLHPYSLIREKQWHTLITSGLIHGDLFHLLFNMITFYFFAFNLEGIVGSLNFFIIYFVSMIVADIKSIVQNKDNYNYRSLGASGAISGILFSYALFAPAGKIMIFPIPFPLPIPLYAVLYLVYCVYAAKKLNDNINHDAHFWGAISGIILTEILVSGSISYFITHVIAFYF